MTVLHRAGTGLHLIVDPQRAEMSLWRRSRYEDDDRAREMLFDRYLVLARTIGSRLARDRRAASVDRGDVDQYACEGLLQAIDRYDPLVGVPFGAYARRRIAGAVATGMSRMTEIGAQSSHRRRIERERLRSLAIGEGDPLAALADLAMGLALGLMLEGTGLVATADAPDRRPDAYESLAWRETVSLLGAEVDRLPGPEATVIRKHYHQGVPFAEIALLLRLSRGRISQLHRSGMERLRRRIGNERWKT